MAVPRPDWSTRWHELRHDRRVAAGADAAAHETAARSDPRIRELLAGRTVREVKVVPGRIVNFVLA